MTGRKGIYEPQEPATSLGGDPQPGGLQPPLNDSDDEHHTPPNEPQQRVDLQGNPPAPLPQQEVLNQLQDQPVPNQPAPLPQHPPQALLNDSDDEHDTPHNEPEQRVAQQDNQADPLVENDPEPLQNPNPPPVEEVNQNQVDRPVDPPIAVHSDTMGPRIPNSNKGKKRPPNSNKGKKRPLGDLGRGGSFKILRHEEGIIVKATRPRADHLQLPQLEAYPEVVFVHFLSGWIPYNLRLESMIMKIERWAKQASKNVVLTYSDSTEELYWDIRQFLATADDKWQRKSALIFAHGLFEKQDAPELATHFLNDKAATTTHLRLLLKELQACNSVAVVFCNKFAKMDWFRRMVYKEDNRIILLSGQQNISCFKTCDNIDKVLDAFSLGYLPFVFYKNKHNSEIGMSCTPENDSMDAFRIALGPFKLCCNYELLWREFLKYQRQYYERDRFCTYVHLLEFN